MSYKSQPTRPIIYAANGMVATGHPLASQAALTTLQKGGNAMDAAITASAVLCVVDPAASGLGGDAFYTYYDHKTDRLESLNASGRSAESLDPQRFQQGIPSFGAMSPTVPGIVHAWGEVVERHCTLSLKELLAPAISYARDGFVVSTRVAASFQRKESLLRQCETVLETYQIDGRWPYAGEVLRLPDLANSLELIANQGVQVMYSGELGERIIKALETHGGLLTRSDLYQHKSHIEDPVLGNYRGYQIAVQQPPTMGTLLLQQLALIEASQAPVANWDSPDWIHLMIEAKKASFGDLSAYLSDPDCCHVRPEQLLDEAYINQRVADLSLEQAVSYAPGHLGATVSHTTYLAVADKEGNVVSWIQSVFNEFGSCWMAPQTGFVLNNRLSGFSNDPKHINYVAAGKRTAHTLLAPMVLKNNKPVLVLGTPGDYGQTQTNLQVLSYILDHGFDVQQAIDAPRWRSLEGMNVAIEGRFSNSLIEELTRRGHVMEVTDKWTDLMGGVQAIAINQKTGSFAGAADARREGYALGW